VGRHAVLILQGGKDVQVSRTDYDLAERALALKPPEMREAHFFPTLNHLLLRVDGQATGGEDGKASHVSPDVIDTIARWVTKWSADRSGGPTGVRPGRPDPPSPITGADRRCRRRQVRARGRFAHARVEGINWY
jgi:hypothetical protein